VRPAAQAALAAIVGLLIACSPVKIARIGPSVPPRGEPCDVEVLEEGQVPDRPYRDVGGVELDNCQDYRVPPCRTWLVDAACELGGHVAYLPEGGKPQTDFAPLRFRLLVAAYVADLRPDPETDIVLKALTCDPPCTAGQVCSGGTCKPADAGCDEAPPSDTDEPPDRCVE
jgi:hypothetical protein